jgi:hypothetical protein
MEESAEGLFPGTEEKEEEEECPVRKNVITGNLGRHPRRACGISGRAQCAARRKTFQKIYNKINIIREYHVRAAYSCIV